MSSLGCDVPDLHEELHALLRQIPYAQVTTYGLLAEALGSRSAARWVGEFMLDHRHDVDCPCHRVVRHTGELGRYITGRVEDKQRKLKEESIEVREGRIELASYAFDAFHSQRPLVPLLSYQEELPRRVLLKPFQTTPDLIAGVDISYLSPKRGVAAYALVETASGKLVWSATLERPIAFPYIPGLLAFREISLHLELLAQAESEGRLAPLLLVDGHGLLHNRQAGIATHLGVVAGIPTVGVGKKLLCGQVDLQGMQGEDSRPVFHQGQVAGMAVKATDRSRPVFVSPGQFIDVHDAARLTRLLFHGHRLPEPIYWADRLSRQAAG